MLVAIEGGLDALSVHLRHCVLFVLLGFKVFFLEWLDCRILILLRYICFSLGSWTVTGIHISIRSRDSAVVIKHYICHMYGSMTGTAEGKTFTLIITNYLKFVAASNVA